MESVGFSCLNLTLAQEDGGDQSDCGVGVRDREGGLEDGEDGGKGRQLRNVDPHTTLPPPPLKFTPEMSITLNQKKELQRNGSVETRLF